MKCPFCKSAIHKVVDKRGVTGSGEIRRRRECLKCNRRFTTYEKVMQIELAVLKKDGRKEVFLREKLQAGIAKALEKRPDFDKVLAITERIEKKLRARGVKEVASKAIGQMVLIELKKLDQVAYLRFASVYRHFDGLEDFSRELKHLSL